MASGSIRRIIGAAAAAALLAFTLAGCSWRNPDFDPARAHHRPDGFVNSDGSRNDKSFGTLASWFWQRWRDGLPRPPAFVDGYAGFRLADPEPARPRAEPGAPTVTWIGHATVLLQMGGKNILTDPQFSERAFTYQWLGPRRKVPLPMSIEQLPPIDIVVISHAHYDHLDRNTVLALAAREEDSPSFLVPLGLAPWFRDLGIERVRAFDWWDAITIDGVEASFVPAHHWSARSAFDRNRTLWGGWVLRSDDLHAYFAGDTGYSRDFIEIGRRFGGFDLALIPVGAYEPRWFMADYHVDPAEAVQIHRDVGSRYSIGIHWGSFELTDESLDAPIDALARALAEMNVPRSEFELLRHGETRRLK
ncbi:MAG: MBL fold metallo-hydrolase [Burkholderiaceae bacterium]